MISYYTLRKKHDKLKYINFRREVRTNDIHIKTDIKGVFSKYGIVGGSFYHHYDGEFNWKPDQPAKIILEARNAKDYKRADEVRDFYISIGYNILCDKQGCIIKNEFNNIIFSYGYVWDLIRPLVRSKLNKQSKSKTTDLLIEATKSDNPDEFCELWQKKLLKDNN